MSEGVPITNEVTNISGAPVEEVDVITISGAPVEEVDVITISGAPVEEVEVTNISGAPVEGITTVEVPILSPGSEQIQNMLAPPPVTPFVDELSLDDILNELSFKKSREDQDRQVLLNIANQSTTSLKPFLIEWAMKGFPNAYPIQTLSINPPEVCADGEVRNLHDYIIYLTNKSMSDIVADLSAKLKGIDISFAKMSGAITLVVSKV